MRVKLGEIGYSSFADINIEIVANATISLLGKLFSPTIAMYRSKMAAATNSVSGL